MRVAPEVEASNVYLPGVLNDVPMTGLWRVGAGFLVGVCWSTGFGDR